MITDQEKFWKGNFGNSYIKRANTNALYKSDLKLFSELLESAPAIKRTLTINNIDKTIAASTRGMIRL